MDTITRHSLDHKLMVTTDLSIVTMWLLVLTNCLVDKFFYEITNISLILGIYEINFPWNAIQFVIVFDW